MIKKSETNWTACQSLNQLRHQHQFSRSQCLKKALYTFVSGFQGLTNTFNNLVHLIRCVNVALAILQRIYITHNKQYLPFLTE